MGRDINYWAERREGDQWRAVGGEERLQQPPDWIVFQFGERHYGFYDFLMSFPERGEPHPHCWNSWVGLLELEAGLMNLMPRVVLNDLEFLEWMCSGTLPLRPGRLGRLADGTIRPDRMRSLILSGRSTPEHRTGVVDLSQFPFLSIWQSLGPLYALGRPEDLRISFSIDR